MNYITKISAKLGNKTPASTRFKLILLMLFTYLLQNTGGLFPAPWGIHARLLVPLVICIGMYEREFAGIFFGLFAGAMLDAFSAQTVCFHSIMLTAAGFAAGALITYVMRNNMTCAVIMTAVFTFIYNSLDFVIFHAFNGIANPLDFYIRYFLLSAVYTILLTPLTYMAVRSICKKN